MPGRPGGPPRRPAKRSGPAKRPGANRPNPTAAPRPATKPAAVTAVSDATTIGTPDPGATVDAAPGPKTAETPGPKTARPVPRWAELTVLILGVLVALALSFATAVWEVVLTPLRLSGGGHARLPVAVLVAVVANAGLVWFARVVTGRVGLSLVPGIVWIVVMLVAGNSTADGDLLVTGDNWVGIATILAGAAAWAIAGYVSIVRGRTPRTGAP